MNQPGQTGAAPQEQAYRLPSVIAVDMSRSLLPYRFLMEEVLQEVLEFFLLHGELRENVELGVLGFNRGSTTFRIVSQLKSEADCQITLEYSGVTHIGVGVVDALRELDSRIEALKKDHIPVKSSMLILLTDGRRPNEKEPGFGRDEAAVWDTAIQEIRRRTAEGTLYVVVIGIGDVLGEDQLRLLSGGENRKFYRTDALSDLNSMFPFLPGALYEQPEPAPQNTEENAHDTAAKSSQPGGDTQPPPPGGDTQPSLPGGDTQPPPPGGDTQPSRPGDDTQPSRPGDDTQPSRSGDDTPPPPPDDEERAAGNGDVLVTEVFYLDPFTNELSPISPSRSSVEGAIRMYQPDDAQSTASAAER